MSLSDEDIERIAERLAQKMVERASVFATAMMNAQLDDQFPPVELRVSVDGCSTLSHIQPQREENLTDDQAERMFRGEA